MGKSELAACFHPQPLPQLHDPVSLASLSSTNKTNPRAHPHPPALPSWKHRVQKLQSLEDFLSPALGGWGKDPGPCCQQGH